MMTDGLQLMVIGMGVVFLFLVLLVILMTVMTAVVQSVTKTKVEDSAAHRIAAVLAVVTAHRRNG